MQQTGPMFALLVDQRIWVPVDDDVWFRSLCLSASSGYWMNLLKVRKAGVLSRHRHPQPTVWARATSTSSFAETGNMDLGRIIGPCSSTSPFP